MVVIASPLLQQKINEMNTIENGLNQLLATYQVYYQNLRNFHWNVKGSLFFELHAKFEELYDDAVLKIDEVAERVLTIDERPLSSFSEYLENSKVSEAKLVTDSTVMVRTVKENLEVLVALENEVLGLANEAGDEGTITLLTDYITQQEKVLWMLKAYLA